MSLAPGRRLSTRLAGIFLFLPLVTKLGFDQLVRQAGYPGTKMVPATAALLSLLTLKLLDKERRSHGDDFAFDEALGLFAGLNVLPKKSFLTDYSYRTARSQQTRLLAGWVGALGKLLFPQPDSFNLDFHPIPYRGDDAELENHYVPRQGKATASVLTLFAQERKSGCLCYANANLTRADQPGELLRFVDFWKGITGEDPRWLYFDSKLVPYEELSQVNERGIRFVTIRRRGPAIVRALLCRPASEWQCAVIDRPKQRRQKVPYLDQTINLRGYEGPIRQIAARLGHERPTLLLSNGFAETPRELISNYAGRNGIEDGLGTSVNFFHLDCLASEVRLNVDLDAAMTVIANGCYRWLGSCLHGFDKTKPKALYRKFVETAGSVRLETDRVVVRFERRAHNPILREAHLEQHATAIPWLDGRSLAFEFV